jgi:hypothetical protein
MRSTEDLAKELFARQDNGRYDRAFIVACHDRDDLYHFTLIKAEDGFDHVLDQLNQCIQDGGHPLGFILGTAFSGPDEEMVGLETFVYPEYEQFEWAHEGMELTVKTLQGDVPGVFPIRNPK